MMNLIEKESESEAGINNIPTRMLIEFKKSCSECNTTSTPLWRGGPAGPKSLCKQCNACGTKYNKRRRTLLGLDKARTEKSKKNKKSGNSNNMLRIVALGREMVLKKTSEEQRMKLGEEEQAAILLMALSCGCVYA